MGLKKADLEEHRAEYQTRIAASRRAEAAGLYAVALTSAMSAWDYIDGSMQYERRFEDKEFESVAAIDVVLKYAPLLFHFEALDQLDALLKTNKRIDKLASDDLAHEVADARGRMRDNRRMFSYLESHPDARQDGLRNALGGDQDYWRWLAETWQKMGLIQRTPEGGSYRLALTTGMGELVTGKCSACGYVIYAPKAELLEKVNCSHCRTTTDFVLTLPDFA